MTSKSQGSVSYIGLVRNNESFRLLWIGQIVSLLGDWFNLIASAALIATLTESGAAVGGLFVVRMLAPFVVSPIAGVAADRYNRKRLLIFTDIVRGLTVLGFLFVRQPNQVWLIYALTAIQMGLSGFFFPTRTAILPDITQRGELGVANAISGTTWSVMLAFGAALGGLSSGLWGIYPSFAIDAVTFFLSALVISRMVYQPPAALEERDKTVAAALRQYVNGLDYLRRHTNILIISLHKSANALFVSGGFQVIQVIIAEQYFPIGKEGGISLGLMYAAVGVGTGISPIVARIFTGDRERPLQIAIALSYIASALGLALAATLVSFPVVLIGTLLRGIGSGVAWVFSTQLLLQLVPNEVQWRVFSTEFMMFTLMNAIAAGSSGALLDTGTSLPGLMLWLAGLTLLPAALWVVWIVFTKRAMAST
jgi:MFS family permease